MSKVFQPDIPMNASTSGMCLLSPKQKNDRKRLRAYQSAAHVPLKRALKRVASLPATEDNAPDLGPGSPERLRQLFLSFFADLFDIVRHSSIHFAVEDLRYKRR